ncbi:MULTISPECIES: phenylacetic acid degradation b [unclassified Thalassotalea]|uniref:phenylacetic acid degradation b n=1 Tax=unclassified Thalassotalea TaxID=2614972 RepID=UPI0010821DCF|nr:MULTISPECIES: phenylacetic acid degradation b [unclassified Thalassotalea]NMP14752.1 phenylacetic acid degradation b [Thalassotalea sp. Y01]QBY03321.1 phenylacetic acid degradation b [Thalassotalea sp. HSM 43]
MSKLDHKKDAHVYEVFGRHKIDKDLVHLGCIYALNDELARAQSYMTYSEKPWVELMCIRQDNILSVVAQDENVVIGFA